MCLAVADLVARGRPPIEQDPPLWMALDRAIEIAGEAASHLSDETRRRHPDAAWRELIATRVLLAHAYHRVDLDLLWDIAIDDLPRLAEALGPIVNLDDGHQDVD